MKIPRMTAVRAIVVVAAVAAAAILTNASPIRGHRISQFHNLKSDTASMNMMRLS